MRQIEAENLKDEIWHAICRKGMPINVRAEHGCSGLGEGSPGEAHQDR